MGGPRVIRPEGKSEELCATRFCRNKHEERSPFCSRCAKKRWRAAHPVESALNGIRDRAKKKKLEFALTLEQFTQFCKDTGYLNGKGNHMGDLNVHRRDHLKGYTIENIEPLEAIENRIQGNWEKKNKIEHDNLPF